MNIICYQFLQRNPDVANFIRYHPIWYRYLSRDPQILYELVNESNVYYGKTLPQRIEKFNHQVQMIHTLMKFASAMKD